MILLPNREVVYIDLPKVNVMGDNIERSCKKASDHLYITISFLFL